MVDNNSNTPNKYEEFIGKFQDLIKYSEGAKNAYVAHGDLSPAIRDLAASLTNDEAVQYDLKTEADKRDITNFLREGVELKRVSTNKFASDNLESLLKDSPKQDIEIAIKYVINPKDSYSGENAKTYEEVSKLQVEFKDMLKVKDIKKIKENVKEFFKNKYANNENEDDSKLVQKYVESSAGFAQRFYNHQIAEKDQEINEKLKGKEAGYLVANLEGKDFLEFYGDLMKAKQKLIEASKDR